MKLDMADTSGKVIGVLIASVWLFGAYHGFKAHSFAAGALAVIVPPYGGYLAIEEIWHKDDQPIVKNYVSIATKEQLWNASMDACQEIINMSQRLPTGAGDIERAKTILNQALALGKDFVHLTEADNNESVKAFREHYMIGLQAMANGFSNNDSQEIGHGVREINLFLDLMSKRAK